MSKILIVFCLALVNGFCAINNAVLSVAWDSVVQKNFLGLSGTYHGFAFMPEQVARGMNDADRKREFDRVKSMGLNIARTWYRPDWACGAKISDPFDWNSTKMQAFYAWLQVMKDNDVDVALQLGWWLYSTGAPAKSDVRMGMPDVNFARDTARFAEWASTSIRKLVVEKGFTNIKYCILFTEPTSYGDVPVGFASRWEYYKPVVRCIHNRLVRDSLRSLVKLVGPNNTYRGIDLDRAAAELNDVLDVYSGHDYNLADYEAWYAMNSAMQSTVKATGKPFWLDEYGKQDQPYRKTGDYGNYIAQAVAASINAGNQSSFIWLLFDQQYVSPLDRNTSADSFYDGVHRWGIAKWPHDPTQTAPTFPYPHWYAFSMMSRLLPGKGAGSETYRTTNNQGVVLSALKTKVNDYSVLLVNKNSNATAYHLLLRPSGLNNRTLYKYVYDSLRVQVAEDAQLIKSSETFKNVRDTLIDTLPARGVVILSTIPDAGNTALRLSGDRIPETGIVGVKVETHSLTRDFRVTFSGDERLERISVHNLGGKWIADIPMTIMRLGSVTGTWHAAVAASNCYIFSAKIHGKITSCKAVL